MLSLSLICSLGSLSLSSNGIVIMIKYVITIYREREREPVVREKMGKRARGSQREIVLRYMIFAYNLH